MSNVRKLHPDMGTVESAVSRAVDGMTWLRPSDDGMVALAKKLAHDIDANPENANWAIQSLMGCLKALGGTPAERKALGVEEVVSGSLAAIRGRRVGQRNPKDSDPASS